MVHVIFFFFFLQVLRVLYVLERVPRNGFSQSPLPAMGKPGDIGTEC